MSNGYQDRGNKKWSAMLLPQHRERLRQMAEDEQKVVKPKLDADQWEDLNYKLQTAMLEKRTVNIIYFKNDVLNNVTGIAFKCESITRTLLVKESNDFTIKIQLSDIIDVIDSSD